MEPEIASTEAVDVTPSMIEAAMNVMWRYVNEPSEDEVREGVIAIYRAMECARLRSSPRAD